MATEQCIALADKFTCKNKYDNIKILNHGITIIYKNIKNIEYDNGLVQINFITGDNIILNDKILMINGELIVRSSLSQKNIDKLQNAFECETIDTLNENLFNIEVLLYTALEVNMSRMFINGPVTQNSSQNKEHSNSYLSEKNIIASKKDKLQTECIAMFNKFMLNKDPDNILIKWTRYGFELIDKEMMNDYEEQQRKADPYYWDM